MTCLSLDSSADHLHFSCIMFISRCFISFDSCLPRRLSLECRVEINNIEVTVGKIFSWEVRTVNEISWSHFVSLYLPERTFASRTLNLVVRFWNSNPEMFIPREINSDETEKHFSSFLPSSNTKLFEFLTATHPGEWSSRRQNTCPGAETSSSQDHWSMCQQRPDLVYSRPRYTSWRPGCLRTLIIITHWLKWSNTYHSASSFLETIQPSLCLISPYFSDESKKIKSTHYM